VNWSSIKTEEDCLKIRQMSISAVLHCGISFGQKLIDTAEPARMILCWKLLHCCLHSPTSFSLVEFDTHFLLS
jgi:hypothetical protein